MSNRKLLVGTLIGVVLVLAASWLAWSAKPRGTLVTATVESPATPRANELSGAPADVGQRSAEHPVADGTSSSSSASTTGALEIRSIALVGRCVDREHRPVADARVELTEISWWPKDQELAKSLWGGAQDPSLELPHAQSAADGTFSIPIELADESPHGSIVTVVARKAGLCRAQERKFGVGHGDFDVGDLLLEPGARASGFVHDTLGQPCGAVRISMWAKGRTTKSGQIGDEVRSTADGRFELLSAPAAPCELLASADDLRKAKLDVDLTNGAETDIDVVLPELRGADSISGIIVDPERQPVKGAWLLEETTSGPEPRVDVQTACDDRGRFRIDGHPDSTFVLTAVDRDYRWCAVRRGDIRSGTHDIVLVLDGTRTFVLRVRGDAGEAIESFGYERRSDAWVAAATSAVMARADGEAKLASDIAPFRLRVFAPGWHSEVVALDPGKLPSVVDVTLHRACTLRGIVRSEGKSGRARVKLSESSLEDLQAHSKRMPAPTPDVLAEANGEFEMTLEGTGTVRLRAYVGAELSAPTEPIVVKPGENVEGIVIGFIPTGAIEGAALKSDGSPATQLTVAATQDEKSIQSVETDEQGHYRIPGLPAGEYLLRAAFEHGVMHFDTSDIAAAGSLQSWRATVEADVTNKVDLRLLDTARCHVALALPDPSPAKWSLEISIRGPGQGADFFEMSLLGMGSADFERLDPFDAYISVACRRSGWPRFTLPKQTIDRGAHDVRIAVTTGRITGTLAPPFAAEETVEMEWKDSLMGARARATIDVAGRFAFECVPVGQCSLERRARPGVKRTVAVNSAESTQVDGL